MLRATHLPPISISAAALSVLRVSLSPSLCPSSSSPSHLHKLSTFAPLLNFLPKTLTPISSSLYFKRMVGHPCPKGTPGYILSKPFSFFFGYGSMLY